MIHEILMPVLSQSMLQGRVVEWLIKEGDKVDKGALLVVVESDKATHELEAQQSGILRKILVEAGAEVDVNTPLAIIADGDEVVFPKDIATPTKNAVAGNAGPSGSMSATGRRPISPAARRLAQELGIDVTKVQGTGDDGLITEKDIHAFTAKGTSSISPEPEDAQVIPLTGQRGRIAERMALSRRTAADVTTVMDVDMGQIAALPRDIKNLLYGICGPRDRTGAAGISTAECLLDR